MSDPLQPQFTLEYLSQLSATGIHPTTLVEVLSEFESELHIEANTIPNAPELFSAFFTIYLLSLILEHDLNEARFLLQRIPQKLQKDPQIETATKLVKAIYTRNYPEIYFTLSLPEWSEAAEPLVNRVEHDFRKSTLSLLSKAYTTITPTSVNLYLGLDTTEEETVNYLVSEGWSYDAESKLLKPSVKYYSGVPRVGQMDDRIERLTSLVTHLADV
ncbi:COP9 signalosome [Pyronema omphalodes]|nr:COP9 signalosome [Pyronema omphalodes]